MTTAADLVPRLSPARPALFKLPQSFLITVFAHTVTLVVSLTFVFWRSLHPLAFCLCSCWLPICSLTLLLTSYRAPCKLLKLPRSRSLCWNPPV